MKLHEKALIFIYFGKSNAVKHHSNRELVN